MRMPCPAEDLRNTNVPPSMENLFFKEEEEETFSLHGFEKKDCMSVRAIINHKRLYSLRSKL
jgi:hypothetical protein